MNFTIKQKNALLLFILTSLFIFNACKKNENELSTKRTLLKPLANNIYFGAFPDFEGSEDSVTSKRIRDFEKVAGKKIA